MFLKIFFQGCKKLLTQHSAAEADLAAAHQKVEALTQLASDLADGHFDGDSIIRNCSELKSDLARLQTPAEERRSILNQSLKYHEYNFDLQRELEWIEEKMTLISSPVDIQVNMLL